MEHRLVCYVNYCPSYSCRPTTARYSLKTVSIVLMLFEFYSENVEHSRNTFPKISRPLIKAIELVVQPRLVSLLLVKRCHFPSQLREVVRFTVQQGRSVSTHSWAKVSGFKTLFHPRPSVNTIIESNRWRSQSGKLFVFTTGGPLVSLPKATKSSWLCCLWTTSSFILRAKCADSILSQ